MPRHLRQLHLVDVLPRPQAIRKLLRFLQCPNGEDLDFNDADMDSETENAEALAATLESFVTPLFQSAVHQGSHIHLEIGCISGDSISVNYAQPSRALLPISVILRPTNLFVSHFTVICNIPSVTQLTFYYFRDQDTGLNLAIEELASLDEAPARTRPLHDHPTLQSLRLGGGSVMETWIWPEVKSILGDKALCELEPMEDENEKEYNREKKKEEERLFNIHRERILAGGEPTL
ncbi:hypothetical protein FRB97_004349 [Tulasnella sp. 331]|nr:hypothetical protein FRB97_004349 [Tulasnella sp. 331]